MTQQSQQSADRKSHFDAAKEIVESLQGMDKTSQTLAMRFAAETLGLQSVSLPHASSPSTLTTALASPAPVAGTPHSTDIKQFTVAKAPKSDQQFAAVVAYFYRFEAPETQRRDTIDPEFLLEAARLAGRKRPSNARFTLNNAKKAGYLDGASAGKFRINSVGENLVAMTLPGNNPETFSPRKSGKKKVSRKKLKKPVKSTRTRS